ncbi:MAG: hypothetical protein HOB14_09575 [Gammaproteobacteria bacterium]|jgi:hypothetical protein|nr:hypothetical protein [Gammaproteobacteria bacterium]MBT6454601.1 hypothetical protein [Gammaproteobacteria bacterium]MBT6701896.1 hypothetical protein [Gammaproteobacteria bacterium]
MEVRYKALQSNKILFSAFIAFFSVAIASCGGGGGSDPVDPPVIVDPDPVTLIEKSITGQVSAGVSGDATVASTSPDINPQSLIDVQVTAILFSGDVEVGTLSTTTDENGAFRLAIAEQDDQLIDRVELTFEKDGYTVGQKTVIPKERTIVITRLGPVNVVTQTRDELAFTASGSPAFRFAIIKQPDGTVAAVAGTDYAKARIAAGTETLLDMSIPADRVSADVSAVTAKIAHFDPNDPNQVQSFPGDFTGTGDVGSGEGIDTSEPTPAARVAAGEEEYRLISSVFSQVDLVDQNGDALALVEPTGARAAADGDDPAMYMSLPLQSYETITADQDDTTAGIQVPIYVYRGGWQYVGNGTLVDFDGTTSTYNVADLTLPLDNSSNLGLYVRIQITGGNEWIRWINLDWPIKAVTDVLKICFIGEIVYAGEDQEKFTGNLNINMPDGGYDWPYIQDGVINFERLVFGGDPTDPANWSFYVWNQRAYKYEYMDLSSIASFSTSTTDCVDNNLGKMELTNPRQYKLFGKATKNGDPVAGVSIRVTGQRFWDWGITNVNGEYSMSVPGTELDFEFGAETGSVHVNGATDLDEDNDDGNAVRLDLMLQNLAPQLTNFFVPRRLIIPAGESQISASVVAAAFDADSDSISFDWNCEPSASCSMSAAATSASAFDSNVQTFTASAAGDYTVSVTVTDNNGGSVSNEGIVIVEQGNRAPRALAVRKTIGTDTALLGCIRTTEKLSCSDDLRASDAGSYEAVYFDPDGDTVNVSWDAFSCPDGDSCDFTATADGVLSAVLSDDAKSDVIEINMNVVANESPEVIYAFALPANILVEQDGSNAEAVTLEAAAIDDVEVVSEAWVVTDADSNQVQLVGGGTTGSDTIAAGELTEGVYVATFTAEDNEGASSATERYIRVFSNAPPQITSTTVSAPVFDATSGTNDDDIVLTAVATDAEGDDLTYSWIVNGQALTGESVTVSSGTLSSGVYEASLVVSDGSGQASDSVGFTVNEPPVIESPTDASTVTKSEVDDFVITASATDDFTEQLTYAWVVDSQQSSGASLTVASGSLSVGSHSATLTVTDGGGLSSTVSLTIEITARVNLAPEISSPTAGAVLAIAEDKDISIQAIASDEFTDVLTYAWVVDGQSFTGSLLSIASGTLVVGSYDASLTVTDEDGASDSVSFTIEVTVVQDGNLEIIID